MGLSNELLIDLLILVVLIKFVSRMLSLRHLKQPEKMKPYIQFNLILSPILLLIGLLLLLNIR